MKKRGITIALLLSLSFVCSANSPRNNHLKVVTHFLKSVPLHATLNRVKEALPANTTIGKVRWAPDETPDIAGNLMDLHGTITGTLSFLTHNQYKLLANPASSNGTHYGSTDPIYAILIKIDGGNNLSKAEGQKRVTALINFLGTPKEKGYETPGDDPGGWYVKWVMADKREIEYYSSNNCLKLNFFNAYGYQS